MGGRKREILIEREIAFLLVELGWEIFIRFSRVLLTLKITCPLIWKHQPL